MIHPVTMVMGLDLVILSRCCQRVETYGKMERKKLKQKIGNPIILNLTSVEN